MSADRHITTRIWSGARLSVVLLLFAAGVARLDAAPKQPILVKNVSMKVPNNIELSGTEPTHAFLWVDVEFDLVNIGRHSVILKNFRIYYRLPLEWHLGTTSPGFGSQAPDSFIYSIDLGTIAPGQFMRRKQRFGIEPTYELLKVNLHTLNSDEYPVVLKWRIDYLVEGQPTVGRGAGRLTTRQTCPGDAQSNRRGRRRNMHPRLSDPRDVPGQRVR
jgi:hypothetical protein